MKQFNDSLVVLALLAGAAMGVGGGCSSSSSDGAGAAGATGATGGPVAGDASTRCQGVTPVVVDAKACTMTDGAGGAAGSGGAGDAGAGGSGAAGEGGAGAAGESAGEGGGAQANPTPGANGDCANVDPDYGDISYGSESDDDDCKYHVKWSVTPFAENQQATFTVTATKLADGTPVTGAAPRAELFIPCELSHVPPSIDFDATPTETSPGTYTIGPVAFDKAGHWAVRFHFSEACDDAPQSPHGHASFYVDVP